MFKKKSIFTLSSILITMLFLFSSSFTIRANAETNNNSIDYTIKKGDTFYLLSLRFNCSINDISSMNPKVDPQNLIIGRKIMLPIGSGITVHHVKKNDTLWKIAKKYNSEINLIAKKNYIENPNLIYAGDILAIPDIKHEQDISTLQKYVISLIRDRNYKELSKFVHPQKGIRFSPYSYVTKQDLVFTASKVANFGSDKTKYIWGIFDGSGFDIEYTPAEYFNRFVYNKDFIKLGTVSYNKTQGIGNTFENQFEVYPNSTIVEYYYPGSEKYSGIDWSSLCMVYEKYNGKWYLVGIIHNEWTT